MTFSELVGAMPEAGELIEPMEREQRIRDAREAVIEAARAHALKWEETGCLDYDTLEVQREAVRALVEAENG